MMLSRFQIAQIAAAFAGAAAATAAARLLFPQAN
jgi:hypothetical protein